MTIPPTRCATVTKDDPSDWRLREYVKGAGLIRTERQIRDAYATGGQMAHDRAHTARFCRYWHHVASPNAFSLSYSFVRGDEPTTPFPAPPMNAGEVHTIKADVQMLNMIEGMMCLNVGEQVIYSGNLMEQHVVVGRIMTGGEPPESAEKVFYPRGDDAEPDATAGRGYEAVFVDNEETGGLSVVAACEGCGEQIVLSSEVSRGAMIDTRLPIPRSTLLHKALAKRPCECWAP